MKSKVYYLPWVSDYRKQIVYSVGSTAMHTMSSSKRISKTKGRKKLQQSREWLCHINRTPRTWRSAHMVCCSKYTQFCARCDYELRNFRLSNRPYEQPDSHDGFSWNFKWHVSLKPVEKINVLLKTGQTWQAPYMKNCVQHLSVTLVTNVTMVAFESNRYYYAYFSFLFISHDA